VSAHTATCHGIGCPQRGVPVVVDVASTDSRVVCGGCQHVVHDVTDADATTPRRTTRRKADG
jgi:hypothetical protein